MKYGAIEAGGTKFVCAVGDENGQILARIKFPTTTPEEVIPQIVAFFKDNPVSAIGIGSFGPIGVNEDSADYGKILNTPKLPFKNYPFLAALKAEIDVPMAWTTDVNIAAYGELKAGAGRGTDNLVYVTIGTGVGAGIVANGELYSGVSHTEVGHSLLVQNPADDFKGACPYHGNRCIEGLAAGPAIEQRFGKKANELAVDDPFWEIEADYLAQMCHNLTLMYAPAKIILGGGVMHQLQLFPLIRQKLVKLINGYVELPNPDEYVVPITLNDDAGVIGGFYLAQDLVKE